MACACEHLHEERQPVRALLARLSEDGRGSPLPCSPHHNRFRVTVAADAGVTAGVVHVLRGALDPERQGILRLGEVQAVPLGPLGATIDGQQAPMAGTVFRADVDGYGGTGDVVVQIETWREG